MYSHNNANHNRFGNIILFCYYNLLFLMHTCRCLIFYDVKDCHKSDEMTIAQTSFTAFGKSTSSEVLGDISVSTTPPHWDINSVSEIRFIKCQNKSKSTQTLWNFGLTLIEITLFFLS